MALGETGISVGLVQQTIGESSGDVMTLCRSTNIKRWSKHKPFRSLTLFHANVAAMEADMNSTDIADGTVYRWGLSVRYGFNADFVDLYSSMWQWDKPTNRGRLGDFRRYDHTATEGPMPYLWILSSEISVEEDTSRETGHEYKATIPIYIPTNDHDLKLSDFSFTYNGTTFNLSQCRIGCYIRMKDSSASVAITDTSYVIGSYYDEMVSLTIGVDYEQLDVDCYICPLLTWGSTSLRFQMDKVQTVKFSYKQPGPTPIPANVDAYHTEEPSYTWDSSTQTITFQYKIGYKNIGDLAATTRMQIKAAIAYGIHEEEVSLLDASPLAAHTSGETHGTRSYTLQYTTAEVPDIYYYFLDENGSWDTVRVLGE